MISVENWNTLKVRGITKFDRHFRNFNKENAQTKCRFVLISAILLI